MVLLGSIVGVIMVEWSSAVGCLMILAGDDDREQAGSFLLTHIGNHPHRHLAFCFELLVPMLLSVFLAGSKSM